MLAHTHTCKAALCICLELCLQVISVNDAWSGKCLPHDDQTMLDLVRLLDMPVDTACTMICMLFVCMYVARRVCKTECWMHIFWHKYITKLPEGACTVYTMNSICRVSPPSLLQHRYLVRLCMLESREETPHYQLGVRPVHSPLHCLHTRHTDPAAAAAAAAADN